MNTKIIGRIVLFCFLISIPLYLTHKTEYFDDTFESVLIGLLISLFAIYKSFGFKSLSTKSVIRGEFHENMSIPVNILKEFKFRQLVNMDNVTLLRDVENRTYVWLKKSPEENTYSIQSSLFPIFNSVVNTEKTKLKFHEMLRVKKNS